MQSFAEPILAKRLVYRRSRLPLLTTRAFSPTTCAQTRLRESMFGWLDGPGKIFRDSAGDGPQYLSPHVPQSRMSRHHQQPLEEAPEEQTDEAEDESTPPKTRRHASSRRPTMRLIPFPTNLRFKSDPVLSEDVKDHIWHRVTVDKVSVRRLSAELHVEMRRVGAVVRLKSLEKDWEAESRRLATPYARAVLSMLPQTPLTSPPTPHESINDLPTHKATLPQVFHITSESKRFTRSDAGKVFDAGLLPADDRIPHPQLVKSEQPKDTAGLVTDREAPQDAWAEIEASDQRKEELRLKVATKAEKKATTVRSGRWNFTFQDVTVDRASVGRHAPGLGSRYGVPAQDRKKGQVKIPTHVE